jgi:hypothetical protein
VTFCGLVPCVAPTTFSEYITWLVRGVITGYIQFHSKYISYNTTRGRRTIYMGPFDPTRAPAPSTEKHARKHRRHPVKDWGDQWYFCRVDRQTTHYWLSSNKSELE